MFRGISLLQLSLIWESAISYHIEHDSLNWQSLDPSVLNKRKWLWIFCRLCSTLGGTWPQLFKDAKKIILDAAIAPWRSAPLTRVSRHKDGSKIHFRMCPHQRGESLGNLRGIAQSCLHLGWKGDSAVAFNYDQGDPGQFGLPPTPPGYNVLLNVQGKQWNTSCPPHYPDLTTVTLPLPPRQS